MNIHKDLKCNLLSSYLRDVIRQIILGEGCVLAMPHNINLSSMVTMVDSLFFHYCTTAALGFWDITCNVRWV